MNETSVETVCEVAEAVKASGRCFARVIVETG